MKKIFTLALVVATALVFTTGAFADPCSNCKCPLRNVPCPVTTQAAPAVCNEFDFDLNTAADGYCTFSVANNCKAILHVCDCLPDPTAFVQSLDVGIRMTLLVDGVAGDHGAYWSAGAAALGPIQVDLAANWAAACALTAHGTATYFGNFGAPPLFYDATNALIAPGALIADPTCTVPAASRAVMLECAVSPGYIVPAVVPPGSGDYWWIDIPPVRIDPALIASGSVVSVKIELLDNSGASLCGGCTLCECIIPIAQVCCAAAAPATNLTFPYFAANSSYWRGLSVCNLGATAGTATLTLHDPDGDTATATLSVPAGGLATASVDSLSWVGAADVNGRSYIQAVCDFAALGFAMMGNGSEAMGYIVP